MIALAACENLLSLYKLALKHRQGKNHKMRIIAFVGSPVEDNEKDVSPGDGRGMREWGLLGKGGYGEFSVSAGGALRRLTDFRMRL